MKKNTKIIFVLSAVAIILLLYFAFSSEKVMIFNSSVDKGEKNTKVSQEEIRVNYTEKMNKFFTDLESLDVSGLSNENIMIMKDQLLGLDAVPEEYREFHLNLVLALDELLKKLDSEESIEKNFESIKMMRSGL